MNRNLKSLFAIATGVLLSGSLASCSDMAHNGQGNTPDPVVTPALRGITFHISMPGQAGHIVDTRVHDAPEWNIKSLHMYVFGPTGNLIEFKDLTGKIVQQSEGYLYNHHFEKGEATNQVRQYIFVANQPQVQVAKMSDLETTLLAQSSTANDCRRFLTADSNIPMTGQAYTKDGASRLILEADGQIASVWLLRTVARIDITNYLTDLTITNISLHNAVDKSVIHHNLERAKDTQGKWGYDYAALNGQLKHTEAYSRLQGLAPFTPVPGGKLQGTASGNEIKKAFYLYEAQNENLANPDNITYVEIEGTYKGVPKVYKVPFKKYNDKTLKFDIPVNVRRNHLYKISIGKDHPTVIPPVTGESTITFTIGEEPWSVLDFVERI